MSDEIKEILDNVKKCCDITKDQSFTVYQRQDILAILDYITNLQEENEQLEKIADSRMNTILDIEKCVEKLKENNNAKD